MTKKAGFTGGLQTLPGNQTVYLLLPYAYRAVVG